MFPFLFWTAIMFPLILDFFGLWSVCSVYILSHKSVSVYFALFLALSLSPFFWISAFCLMSPVPCPCNWLCLYPYPCPCLFYIVLWPNIYYVFLPHVECRIVTQKLVFWLQNYLNVSPIHPLNVKNQVLTMFSFVECSVTGASSWIVVLSQTIAQQKRGSVFWLSS